MKREELQQEIDDYFYNLILNSTFETWTDAKLVEDNIKIVLEYGMFKVNVYTDNTHKSEHTWFYIDTSWSWKKEKRKKNRILKRKLKEIESYFNNTEGYIKTLKTYNLLPIKEQRKRKLQEIKNKI